MPPTPSFPFGVIFAILWPGARRTLLKSKTKESSSCLQPTGAPCSRIRQHAVLSSVPTAAPVTTEGRPAVLAALLGLLATYRAKTVPLPPGKV